MPQSITFCFCKSPLSLEHSHTFSWHIVCDCFPAADANGCNRKSASRKRRNVCLRGHLQEKFAKLSSKAMALHADCTLESHGEREKKYWWPTGDQPQRLYSIVLRNSLGIRVFKKCPCPHDCVAARVKNSLPWLPWGRRYQNFRKQQTTVYLCSLWKQVKSCCW